MNDKRVWTIAAILFLLAAVASAIGGSWVAAVLLAVAGVLFLYQPTYMANRKRRR